jgi:hypothetical protein
VTKEWHAKHNLLPMGQRRNPWTARGFWQWPEIGQLLGANLSQGPYP